MAPKRVIDSHQHLWMMSERAYSWIAPEYGPLYDDFSPERLAPEIPASGVTDSILVQAADTYEDTFYMLDIAAHSDFVKGVVGWVPFDRPNEARAALEVMRKSPYFKGVRNLSHDYSNPKYESDDKWITRPAVLESIAMVEKAGLALDYVAVNPAHVDNVPVLAAKFPNLKIVVDHFAKPGIADKTWEPWATQMTALAKHKNVYMKFSGLNTASAPGWTVADWQPYVDHVVTEFGAKRTLLGGDWPVVVLMNNYVEVWKAQLQAISQYSNEDQEWITHRTAEHVYGI